MDVKTFTTWPWHQIITVSQHNFYSKYLDQFCTRLSSSWKCSHQSLIFEERKLIVCLHDQLFKKRASFAKAIYLETCCSKIPPPSFDSLEELSRLDACELHLMNTEMKMSSSCVSFLETRSERRRIVHINLSRRSLIVIILNLANFWRMPECVSMQMRLRTDALRGSLNL